jgi:hypothetical protein
MSRPLTLLALAGFIDITLTLLGQSHAYWAGDYSKAREGNPLAEPLLTWNPWAFAAITTAWIVALIVLLHFWKHRFAEWVAIVAFAGHTFGGAAWIMNLLPHGWIVAVGYVAIMIGMWSRVNRRQRVGPVEQ